MFTYNKSPYNRSQRFSTPLGRANDQDSLLNRRKSVPELSSTSRLSNIENWTFFRDINWGVATEHQEPKAFNLLGALRFLKQSLDSHLADCSLLQAQIDEQKFIIRDLEAKLQRRSHGSTLLTRREDAALLACNYSKLGDHVGSSVLEEPRILSVNTSLDGVDQLGSRCKSAVAVEKSNSTKPSQNGEVNKLSYPHEFDQTCAEHHGPTMANLAPRKTNEQDPRRLSQLICDSACRRRNTELLTKHNQNHIDRTPKSEGLARSSKDERHSIHPHIYAEIASPMSDCPERSTELETARYIGGDCTGLKVAWFQDTQAKTKDSRCVAFEDTVEEISISEQSSPSDCLPASSFERLKTEETEPTLSLVDTFAENQSLLHETSVIAAFNVVQGHIEKLCIRLANHNDYCLDLAKIMQITELGGLGALSRVKRFDPEILGAVLQKILWQDIVSIILTTPTGSPDITVFRENTYERFELRNFESSCPEFFVAEVYPHLSAVLLGVEHLSVSMKKSNIKIFTKRDLSTGKDGWDLFPVTPMSDGILIVGSIPILTIDDDAIIIAITPAFEEKSCEGLVEEPKPRYLVRGTAIVYEPKRCEAILKSNYPETSYALPGLKTENLDLKSKASISSTFPPLVPRRPQLQHRKNALQMEAILPMSTPTPENSPVSERRSKPKPPLPIKRSHAVVFPRLHHSSHTNLSCNDSRRSENRIQNLANFSLKSEISKAGLEAHSVKVKQKSCLSVKRQRGPVDQCQTPLAAIWRSLESRDQRYMAHGRQVIGEHETKL